MTNSTHYFRTCQRRFNKGKSLTAGEGLEYIFTNAGHNNPLYRVIPMGLVKKNVDYDKEMYRDMILGATEAVLDILVSIELFLAKPQGKK